VHTSRIAASTLFETMLRKLSVMLPRAVADVCFLTTAAGADAQIWVFYSFRSSWDAACAESLGH
jgi:hypothetical protein